MLAAASLEGGAAAFERRTGVRLPEGGRHPRMGTHNRLARLGADAFLEIIAIDPEAPAPERPRWFGLDDAATPGRAGDGVALLTWVVGVPDIDAALARASAAGVEAGRAVEQVRDDLRWRIAVRDDGRLVEGGVFPVLIEWPPGSDAPSRMAELGLGLDALSATHPEPGRIARALEAIGAGTLIELDAGPAALRATVSAGGHAVRL